MHASNEKEHSSMVHTQSRIRNNICGEHSETCDQNKCMNTKQKYKQMSNCHKIVTDPTIFDLI